MKALVIGATGAVGKDLVDLLLKEDSFESVSVFVRRPLGFEHPTTRQPMHFDSPLAPDFQQLINLWEERNL